MFRLWHVRILLLSYCFMIVFCSQKDELCGSRSEKRQTHFIDTIKHIGIKLCEQKYIENGHCLTFQYNIKALTCRLSSDESKRIKSEEGNIIIPTTQSSVPPSQCGSKSCLPKFRCLKTRNGQAVCVKDWKQSFPGVAPQHMKRKTLKSKLYDACKEGDLKKVKWILSHTRVNMNCRCGKMKVTPLLLTAFHGHRQVYDFLVSKGADVSLVGADGSNILHVASEGGHEEMVKCVLSQNIVDINSRDKRGRTPVMRAVYFGQRDVYNLLVISGADISLVDNTLRNILFLATGPGHVQIVQDILARDIVELNSRADGDMTAVMLSAVCGRKEVYSILISEGADVLLVDDPGHNILHVACWGGHVDMVKYILSQNIADINSRDGRGLTSVMVAACHARREVFDFIVNKGADVHNGRNILHCASKGGHEAIVKYILSQNIVDINIRDKKRTTALMVSAYAGHREVFDLLISEGADVSLVNGDGRNILYSAALGGHVSMVRYILSQNIVDINSRDGRGFTPVMVAACHGRRKVYDFLVNKGADVSLVNDDGRNSLYGAAAAGHVEMVKYILSQNIVDINSRDGRGRTPLMVAAYGRYRDVFDLLVNEGADVSLVTNDGNNVLHTACTEGHTRMVKHILLLNVVDIKTRNGFGHTPAMIAKQKGNMAIYKLLQSHARGSHTQ